MQQRRTDDFPAQPNTGQNYSSESEVVPVFLEGSPLNRINHNKNVEKDGANSVVLMATTIDTTGREIDNISVNPFMPPPLKMKILKRIEKGEFVEFDDLIPTNITTTHSMGDHFIDIDTESSALRLRQKEKKSAISNLAHWMMAWNKFIQALLHYRP